MDSVIKAILATGNLSLAIMVVIIGALVGVIVLQHKSLVDLANGVRADRAEALKGLVGLTQMLNDLRVEVARWKR